MKSLSIWATRHLRRAAKAPTSKIYTLPSREFRHSLSEYFRAQNGAAIESAIAGFCDGARMRVGFDPAAVRSGMSCAWSRSQTRGSSFILSSFKPGNVVNTVVNRWLAAMGTLRRSRPPENPSGRVVINFDTSASNPAWHFVGIAPTTFSFRIPIFLSLAVRKGSGTFREKAAALGSTMSERFLARELVGKKKQPNFGNAASALMPDRQSREA